ncbi:protein kinase [Nonomuraea sp. NPDC050328]|uniref:protein kinase domain-containing protein n=1 Tax=Nonomuraea sp. NPDC050328 TaxID=3364361 RepID=UPI003791726E
MRLLPGDPERLGGYWLAGRLGTGGQGIVYEAYDEQGRRFAVKVLHYGVPDQMAKEAQAAGKVASFCTARVVEVRLEGPQPYLVSEFVAGPDLRRAVQRQGPYQGGALDRLAAALATALAAVHRAGVVHRDFKPENVLLGPDGPRVIDFGVARLGQTSSTGFAAGTPTYMAPEVFTGARASAASDVFAWGGVVLFAATGEDPFQAESLGGVMHRVLTVDPDLGPLRGPLRELVGRALAKDPGERPSAEELLLGLLDRGASQEEDPERAGFADLAPPPDPAPARPLGERAEELYATLTPAQQEALPGLLLRMLGEDSVRPLPAAEIDDPELISRLTEKGLLLRRSIPVPPTDTETGKLVAVGDGSVVPASAALFHAWPRLRGWVAEDRDGLPTHRRLREAARRWAERDRRRADLLHGSALDEALTWAATGRRHLAPNRLERDYLAAARAQARRRGRFRAMATIGLAAMLAVAVAASLLVLHQHGELSVKLTEANARAIAARADSVRGSDPRAAMRLSVAAWKVSPVFEARTALQRSLAQPELAVFTDPEADTGARYQLADDGRGLVRWLGDRVTRWDVATGARIADHTVPADLQRASELSPDGALIAGVRDGATRVLDLATGRQVGEGLPAGDYVWLYGGRLVTVTAADRDRLYSATTGDELLDVTGKAVTASADGRWVCVADHTGRVELWEVGTRRRTYSGKVEPPVTREAGPPPAAFSADGRRLAIVGSQGTVLVDTAKGRAEPELLAATAATAPAFSPDGRFLAIESQEGFDLWRLSDGHLLAGYPADEAGGDFAFSADGRRLTYLKDGGSVVSLDVSGAVERPDPRPELAADSAVTTLSADGKVVAAEAGATIELTDAELRRPLGRIEAKGAPAFAAGGKVMAIAGDPVTVWTVADRTRIAQLDVGEYRTTIALSPDGDTLAAAGNQDVQVWDVRAAKLTRTVRSERVTALAFSPDGQTLAAGADLIHLPTGRVARDKAGVARLAPTSIAFSPDGRSLAYGLNDGRIQLWSVAERREAGSLAAGENVNALRFSPDGRLLAVNGRWVRLWEVTTLRELGQVPIGQYSRELAFSQDGRRLLGVLPDGSVQDSPVDPALAVAEVCERAGGGLSRQEWERWIPETAYRTDLC